MVTGLGEEDAVIFHSIDEAVFLGDAQGADSQDEMAQWLGFADACEWVAADGYDQIENPACGFTYSLETET